MPVSPSKSTSPHSLTLVQPPATTALKSPFRVMIYPEFSGEHPPTPPTTSASLLQSIRAAAASSHPLEPAVPSESPGSALQTSSPPMSTNSVPKDIRTTTAPPSPEVQPNAPLPSGSGSTRPVIPPNRRIGAPMYPCPYAGCGNTYPQQLALRRHTREVHEHAGHACLIGGCARAFAGEAELEQHILHVHQPVLDTRDHRMFGCPVVGCSARLRTEEGVEKHIRKIHPEQEGERRYACQQEGCVRSYRTEDGLKRHLKAIHEKNAEAPKEPLRHSAFDFCWQGCYADGHVAFLCYYPACGKMFVEQSELTEHEKIHEAWMKLFSS
ncbi:hypothetical protein BV25DRAFT_1416794 [Artomyces pyxidatus]|uniref:Uncharacterized protein n=1 Tax=Artomyces pyxidatus TaxID=48021 RepID=A0ACB8TE11_9AGAM|nr:hypothetical protein BV25DRAFT_1416794 [Artomyces pyxidatus]